MQNSISPNDANFAPAHTKQSQSLSQILFLGEAPKTIYINSNSELRNSKTQKQQNQTQLKMPPVIVLAHGAFHDSLCWEKLIPKLEAQGFTCRTVDFPSTCATPTPHTLDADIKALRDVVDKEVNAGHDVAVVMHSWGGVPGGSAMVGYSKEQRAAKGLSGGVVRLIYVAALLIPAGKNIFDTLGPQLSFINPLLKKEDTINVHNPVYHFYGDLDRKDQEYWVSKLRPHSRATFSAKPTGNAWKEIPTVYLMTDYDKAVPPLMQRAMVKVAQLSGAKIRSENISSAHSPFLSHIDDVEEFIRRAVC
jgi:pimeloyl-ACP methyl ester carboxylesterase